jgi:EAL domain-containing protein (putative c-di-GMP-specific phosphodiesterase class I)
MNTEKSLQIVRGMMVLAHSLGLKVVAEGVETSEQIIQLIDMDCKLVQGFLFSRPVPARAATDLLTNAYQLTAASPKLLRDCFR